ncbi:hypothetical protein WFZ85_11870 [Flavobacterium sp. j3]|uniref:Chaperone of endosialidase n=1 Tax=Flavobacterium aureirubrum TaxID=3133147 RepID=A0ABU9N6I2_9FLAO
MKNLIFVIALMLSVNVIFAQLLPTGTATTDNKYRSGGIGIGYSTAPTFETNKFMVAGGTSYFGGNVGIGTLTPSESLNLTTGNLKLDSGRMLFGTVANFNDTAYNWAIKSNRPFLIASSSTPMIEIQSTISNAYGFLNLAIAPVDYGFSNVSKKGDVIFRGYTSGSMIFNCEGTGNIKFTTIADTQPATQSQVQMTITKTGNIGIGTETPDTKLAVNGTVHAKEVVVDLLGWPDYVFEDDFNLMPLEEVEKYINENKHLPNVPSAKVVESDGLNLGEMNKKLIEKVEELTLYVIQLNKELQQVKSQLKN